MKRAVAALVAALVVAAAVPAVAALGASAPADENPGASFAGVVGVQEAELGNELAQRSFDHRLNEANSNSSKAAVVAAEQERISERLDELEQRRQELNESYQSGEINRAQYEARLAAIGAQTRALERQANQSAAVAEDLPEQALREHGVNVSELRQLAHRADEVGGGEVAAAARQIGGQGVGQGLQAQPENKGQNRSADARNASDGQDGQAGGQGDGQDAGNRTNDSGAGNGQDGKDNAGGGDRGDDGKSNKPTPTETPTPTTSGALLDGIDWFDGW